jgi:hypothetical protein
MEFKDELEEQKSKPDYKHESEDEKNQTSKTGEGARVYQQEPEGYVRRGDYEHLQGNFSKIADSNLKLATAQDKMSDGHLMIIKDQHTLITLLVSKFGINEGPNMA